MEFTTSHVVNRQGEASSIIELTVKGDYFSSIIENVTDQNGRVSLKLINSLRSVADELEEQNRLVNQRRFDQ